jgi:hypothetical protein
MATFYLLPPRPYLDDAFRRFRDAWLPGLSKAVGPAFPELLEAALSPAGDAFVVFRDDLPEGVPLESALRHGFGADDGDAILEVRAGTLAGEVRVRQWRLGAAAERLAVAG